MTSPTRMLSGSTGRTMTRSPGAMAGRIEPVVMKTARYPNRPPTRPRVRVASARAVTATAVTVAMRLNQRSMVSFLSRDGPTAGTARRQPEGGLGDALPVELGRGAGALVGVVRAGGAVVREGHGEGQVVVLAGRPLGAGAGGEVDGRRHPAQGAVVDDGVAQGGVDDLELEVAGERAAGDVGLAQVHVGAQRAAVGDGHGAGVAVAGPDVAEGDDGRAGLAVGHLQRARGGAVARVAGVGLEATEGTRD